MLKSHTGNKVHRKNFKNNIHFAFSFFLRKLIGTGSNSHLAEIPKNNIDVTYGKMSGYNVQTAASLS